MQTTDFLKKYSLIDNNFIDDFYSFYDEGRNEYDFCINLEKIAFWLELRKDNLKRLLESNFIKDQDYIEKKPDIKLKGTGKNNIKIVLLTYNCAKLLCMISKCKKAAEIRNYYIELEKLVIRHKDDINEKMEENLGIKKRNKTIINKHNKTPVIYILKVDDETYKIGKSTDLKNRMKQYNVGRVNDLPLVFAYKTDHIDEIENCIKMNLKQYQLKNKTELYKIDLPFVKETIQYCTRKDAVLIHSNKKLLKTNDNKNWLIIIDKENIDNVDDISKVKEKISKITKTRIQSRKLTKKNKSHLIH